MQRRQFVQSSLFALWPLVGCSAPPTPDTAARAPALAQPLPTVGLQLYTVRDMLAADPDGTFLSIATVGYREVEFASYLGLDASSWKDLLTRFNLAAPAAHHHIEVFQNSFEVVLNTALTLGHRYLVLPVIPAELRSEDGYRQVAALLNDKGALAAQSGIEVAFHNHDFDFQPLPQSRMLGYDILAGELDPNLVRLELDIYWIAITGQSPIDYFQRYSGRYRLCHLKDASSLGGFEDVGYGTLDWPSIIDAAKAAGVEHFIVEHDQPTDAYASIKRSYEYLTGRTV